MKRIAAIILSALLLVTTMLAVPFVTLAEGEKNYYTNVDFSEESDILGPDTHRYNAELSTDPDTQSGHGEVMQITVIGGNSDSRKKDGGKFAIPNADGSGLFFTEANVTYTIKFDMKRTKADVDFQLMLGYLNDYNGVGWNYFSGAKIADLSSESNGEWTSYSCTFKTDGVNKLTLCATNSSIGNDKRTGQQIYIDNIVINTENDINYVGVSDTSGLPSKILSSDKYENVLIDPSVEGFGGWYLDADFTKPAVGIVNKAGGVTVYAKNSASHFTNVDYDGTYKGEFIYEAAVSTDPDTASGHGNVLKFARLSCEIWGFGTKDAAKAMLPNDAGTGLFKVKNGVTYNISLDLKIVNGLQFDLYAFYTTDSSPGWSEYNKTKIAGYSATQNGSWHKVTGSFTSNVDGNMGLLVVTRVNTARNHASEIYADNITVSAKNTITYANVSDTTGLPTTILASDKYEDVLVNPSVSGFEGWYLDEDLEISAAGVVDKAGVVTLYAKTDKVKYYTNVDYDETYTGEFIYQASVATDPDTASGHGNVLKFARINNRLWNTTFGTKDTAKAMLPDDAGTGLFKVQNGVTYGISLDLKIASGVQFDICVFYTTDADPGWAEYSKTKIASFSATQNGTWQKVTGSFTSTVDGNVGLLITTEISGGSRNYDSEIYADNITVGVKNTISYANVSDTTGLPTTILASDKYEDVLKTPTLSGFDGWYLDEECTRPAEGIVNKIGGVTVYSKTSNTNNYTHVDYDETYKGEFIYEAAVSTDPDTASGHGNVLKFSRLNCEIWGFGTKDAAKAMLPDNAGTGLFKVKKDATYNISLDLKIVNGLQFDLYAFYTTDSSPGWAEYDKTKIAGYSATQNGSWHKVTGSFTSTVDGNVGLLVVTKVNTSRNHASEIYADNIYVGEKLSYNIVLNKNNGESKETITKPAGTEYDSLPVPTKTDYEFAGWYLDEGLTQKATGTITGSVELWAKWDIVASSSAIDFDEPIYKNSTEMFIYKSQRVADHNGAGDSAAMFNQVRHNSQGWQNGIILADNSGTGIYRLQSGATYDISYDIKIGKAENAFGIYMLITDNTGNMAITGSLGNIVPNRRLSGHAAVSGETKYTRYTTSFVAPASGKAVLSLISDGYLNIDDQQIYIDNVTITMHKAHEITLYKNNGQQNETIFVALDEKNFLIPEPKKSGEVFVGWYIDANLTTPFSFGVIDKNTFNVTKLYAKWTAEETTPYGFETGFEANDYAYSNNGGANDVNNNVMDRNTYINTSLGEANTGDGFLVMSNPEGLFVSDSDRWLSTALLDKNGKQFQVVAGTRYRLTYNVKFTGSPTGNLYYNFVTTTNVPTGGINKTNSTIIPVEYNYSGGAIHGAFDYWYSDEVYFIAEKTGKVYLTAYSTSLEQQVCFDDIKFEIADPDKTALIQYYNEDGSKLIHETFGESGTDIHGYPGTQSQTGKRFNGWRTADGKLWTGSKYPAQDLKLYASWRAADVVPENPQTDFGADNTITLDFDNLQDSLSFYWDSEYLYGGPHQGMYVVADDPDGAHSGSAYYRFYRASHWMKEYYRKMRIMNADSPNGLIWLEPNTVYKVSYWYNPDTVGASNLYLANFSDEYTDGYEVLAENYLNDAAIVSQFGKWNYYEATVFTGSHKGSLGFVLYGGYFTVSIDDISVTKCSAANVSFETNGGNDIVSIDGNSHHYFIGPDDPVREGYVFKGWYQDSNFTKPFDFTTDLVLSDMVLYAKWEPKKNKTIITYREEQIEVDVTPEDAYLDEALGINDTKDKIGDITGNTVVQSTGLAWLWILLVAADGVILVAGITVLIIILIKRKKKEA